MKYLGIDSIHPLKTSDDEGFIAPFVIKWKSKMDEAGDCERFKHAELDCMIVCNLISVWCGYVGLPKGHPLYGKSYDDLADLDVHGGLIFSAEDRGLWWLGFDCAHFGDLIPEPFPPSTEYPSFAVYRNKEYVRKETKRLAETVNSLGK